jgi:Zn finger protein HypA/HybF involved in hydrogenase expression
MHELSIALEVCRMAEDHVGRAQLPNVVGVDLEVGDQSGLEIDNLMFCLETLLSNPPFTKARPTITRTSGDVLRLTSLEIDDGRPDD